MSLQYLESVILHRRIIKPQLMNGRKIDDAIVAHLLTLADWAPTHGHTEPWRFFVFSGEGVKRFCADHANLYQSNTPPETFLKSNYDKLYTMGDNASHIAAVAMKRGSNPKIPAKEEVAAVCCSVQNLLLAAQAHGIAAYWGTGGMTYHPSMKKYFDLGEEDQMVGLIYLGYSDITKAGSRIIPLDQKIIWK
jgi:nitroreductase